LRRYPMSKTMQDKGDKRKNFSNLWVCN
jgi:hypothetical protein